MKLKRIHRAMLEKYGKVSRIISNANGTGSVEYYDFSDPPERSRWITALTFDDEEELRAHLGITKKDRCRERLVK
jgi:hypothetical protein